MRSDLRALRVALALSMVITSSSCKWIRESGKAEEISHELFKELTSLPVPPTAKLIVEERFANWGRATASAEFSTGSTWNDVRFFYRRELAQRGWQLAGTRVYRDWGRDYGERAEVYCRDGYEAELDWGGQNVKKWTYALTLEWTTNVSPCHSRQQPRASPRSGAP